MTLSRWFCQLLFVIPNLTREVKEKLQLFLELWEVVPDDVAGGLTLICELGVGQDHTMMAAVMLCFTC